MGDEKVQAFLRVEEVDELADRRPKILDGSLGGISQQGFELCESVLDGIEIGAVGREIEEFRARRFDQLAHPTEQTRGRMAQIARKTKRYPSDLTDEEWERIAPLMPKSAKRGRRRSTDFREIINAVRYLVRSGCGWRMPPIHFGPWVTVYWWFRRLARRFLFQTIHDLELMLDREEAGREASPSAGVIDSQTVKAPAPGAKRSFDGGKKIVGRKRHIAVETDGRLLMVNITPADISDSAGAQTILDGVRKRWPRVKHLFADGAYDRLQLMDKAAYKNFTIQIVRRSDKQVGSRFCRTGGSWSEVSVG